MKDSGNSYGLPFLPSFILSNSSYQLSNNWQKNRPSSQALHCNFSSSFCR